MPNKPEAKHTPARYGWGGEVRRESMFGQNLKYIKGLRRIAEPTDEMLAEWMAARYSFGLQIGYRMAVDDFFNASKSNGEADENWYNNEPRLKRTLSSLEYWGKNDPKLCGHFNAHWTQVTDSQGTMMIKYCSDCGIAVSKSWAEYEREQKMKESR